VLDYSNWSVVAMMMMMPAVDRMVVVE